MKVGDVNIEEIVFENTKKLLLRFGVKGWNMNDLANECNMSKRTLYKIIGNKEDLFSKISQNCTTKEITRLENFLQSNKPFPTLLNNLSKQIIESFDDVTLSNLITIRMEYPNIREMEKLFIKEQGDFFVKFFQKGKDEGCIVDNIEASTIQKIVHALVEYHIYNCNNKTDFKNEMEEILNAFFRGIMK